MNHWAQKSIFYHIYPLGFCGAPLKNDFTIPPVPRLDKIHPWVDHLVDMGINAMYLGPVFESSSHGYDTVDYFHVDRRLGDRETLTYLTSLLHKNGIRVILDAVFNHVGRDFWAFRDVQTNLQASPYVDWFYRLQFGSSSPYHDPFTYEGWSGHYNLVKLNHQNQAVKEHLFKAVENWVEHYEIDGLRLDAADAMDLGFLSELGSYCHNLKSDFWLMGEVVHGDYRRWANPTTLDSVTNYECYKGLYSSHNDKNYFEIAYSLNREFGPAGIYPGLPLYAFADNHDVNRVASSLKNRSHLFPLYTLLFTMPGVPSIYYGSEFGIEGEKTNGSDLPLRPEIDLSKVKCISRSADLTSVIGKLARIRLNTEALYLGDYQQLYVGAEQFVFSRQTPQQQCIVMVNSSDQIARLDIPLPQGSSQRFSDRLNPGEVFQVVDGRLPQVSLYPNWGRILVSD